jgi:hypothetical protein
MFFTQEDTQKGVELDNRLSSIESRLQNIPDLIKDSLRSSLDELLTSSLTISCIKEEIDRRYKRSRQDLAEFTKDLKKSEKEAKDTQDHLNRLEEDFSKSKSLIGDILTDLKLKAYNGDLNRLERQLDTKCSNATANELAAQLKLAANAEDLEKTQIELNSFKEAVFKNYFRQEEAVKQLARIESSLLNTLENYSTKEQTSNLGSKFHRKFKKLHLFIENISNNFGNLQNSFESLSKELRSELSLKVSVKDLEKVTLELQIRVTKADLNKYLGQINPKITGFESELGTFNRILREQEQAMLRLDEVLLGKASKLETHDLYLKVGQISKHSDIEYKIDDMIAKLAKNQVDFEDLNSDMRRVKLEFAEIVTHHSKRSNDGMEIKFLKDLMLDMQTNISYKADRTEVLTYLEQKAGWGDFNHLTQSLESVHRQIKLLAVQVGALEKISAPSGKLRNAERTQREYFNRITNKLVNFVVNSKPTLDENPVPEELKGFLRLPETPKVRDHIKRISTPNRRTHHSFDFLNNA